MENDKYIIFNNKQTTYLPNIKNIKNNKTIIEWLINNNANSNANNNVNSNAIKNNIILINGHIILSNEKLNDIFAKLHTNRLYIELISKMKGGDLLDMFMSIIQIGKVFLTLLDFIMWFIKFVIWFCMFIIWILKFIFYDLPFDFYNSLLVIIVTVFTFPKDIIAAIMAFSVNTIGGWMQGFWGWDQSSLTYNDQNSNYFQRLNLSKGKKCYITNTNTVPFSIILGTIICPPLGVFMDLGISGWFNILICILLTLCFYIPGLLYALFVIYS
jgi:uncharacterized membrane protein YqaE (UPF0057 family)